MITDAYDRDGKPLPESWWKDNRPGDWFATSKRVGNTLVGDVHVSTVWLTLDHRYPGMPSPLIFETMVFGGEWNNELVRYSTEEEALRGHLETLDRLRDGLPPFAHLEAVDA